MSQHFKSDPSFDISDCYTESESVQSKCFIKIKKIFSYNFRNDKKIRFSFTNQACSQSATFYNKFSSPMYRTLDGFLFGVCLMKIHFAVVKNYSWLPSLNQLASHWSLQNLIKSLDLFFGSNSKTLIDFVWKTFVIHGNTIWWFKCLNSIQCISSIRWSCLNSQWRYFCWFFTVHLTQLRLFKWRTNLFQFEVSEYIN
jgi:hypothetical protein